MAYLTVTSKKTGQEWRVLVDDDMYPFLILYRWHPMAAHTDRDSVKFGRMEKLKKGKRVQRTVLLHRHIMGDPPAPGMVTDHINGDQLNCTRANLRWCTRAENARNRCVSKRKKSGLPLGVRIYEGKYYGAVITFDHKRIFLGLFQTLEEATAARHAAELLYYKEFAPCLRQVAV